MTTNSVTMAVVATKQKVRVKVRQGKKQDLRKLSIAHKGCKLE